MENTTNTDGFKADESFVQFSVKPNKPHYTSEVEVLHDALRNYRKEVSSLQRAYWMQGAPATDCEETDALLGTIDSMEYELFQQVMRAMKQAAKKSEQ